VLEGKLLHFYFICFKFKADYPGTELGAPLWEAGECRAGLWPRRKQRISNEEELAQFYIWLL
jgi:hypothetical protein